MEVDEKSKDPNKGTSSTQRRSFLRLALAVSVLAALGGISSVVRAISAPAEPETSTTASSTATRATTSSASSSITGLNGFPVTFVATVSSLQVNQPVYFDYPLADEASILVKLGKAVTDGVGPDSDIIAYSQVCQHLGCIYAFIPPGSSPKCNSSYTSSAPVGYCCCHGSIYDFSNAANVIGGPAPRPVPRVLLDIDASGNIYAIGMSGANIYGHPNGDLQG